MARPASLRCRDQQVLAHLALADAIGRSIARRWGHLVEAEDLVQVAREALVRSIPRLAPGSDPVPYLRRSIQGALQHHLRDRVRLVRVSRREHERGTHPLGHGSLDALLPSGGTALDLLAAPEPEAQGEIEAGALEVLLGQLPAAQAAVLRLTVLQGLSYRQAAQQLGVSHATIQRAREAALAALRQRVGA
jgi:RNA polymerase sigma-B factor